MKQDGELLCAPFPAHLFPFPMQHLQVNGKSLKGRYTIASHFATMMRQVAAMGDVRLCVESHEYQRLDGVDVVGCKYRREGGAEGGCFAVTPLTPFAPQIEASGQQRHAPHFPLPFFCCDCARRHRWCGCAARCRWSMRRLLALQLPYLRSPRCWGCLRTFSTSWCALWTT
jgi:hypothetical protein